MSKKVTLVDYGVGNLLSVRRALETCGGEVTLSGDPDEVAGADRLVVPGVGAFGACVEALAIFELIDALKAFALSGRPLLGICVGMQMLMETGSEFGDHKGLGLIPGRVSPIPQEGADGRPHKIPHIGWNRLVKPAGGPDWSKGILADVKEGEEVYFVHSFTAVPSDPAHRLADCDYDGCTISAAVGRGAVYGCQFHPEKSGPTGLKILSRFLTL